MSISYCNIIAKKEKILLAESTIGSSFEDITINLLPAILRKNVFDKIEIENDNLITFLRTKKVILLCVSHIDESEGRIKRFIEQFANLINKEYNGINNIIPQDKVTRLILQPTLENKINKFLNEFGESQVNTSTHKIKSISKDVDDMKQTLGNTIKNMVGNREELEQMLITSKKIVVHAVEYKDESKALEQETRCIKPWMLYLMIVTLILFVVYTSFSLYLCGNMWIICERKNERVREFNEIWS